jgi:hypothetical protein
MRAVIALVSLNFFSLFASAQEAEIKLPSIVTMKVEEVDKQYGGDSWSLVVSVDADIEPCQVEPLRRLSTRILGMQSEELIGGMIDKKNLEFRANKIEGAVPYMTEKGLQYVTGFWTVQQPGIERIEFAKTGDNIPAMVKFRQEAKLVQKLSVLLAVAKFIEEVSSGSDSADPPKLRLMRDDTTTYTIEAVR